MIKFQLQRLWFQFILLITTNLGALGIKTGFCYPFFYCQACPAATSACPLRAVEQSVYKTSLTWRFLAYPLLILGFMGSTTGRSVCGWACPIGLLQRGTGNVARKIGKYSFIQKLQQAERKIDGYLRYMKYAVLIGLVILTPMLIGFMFTDICPVGFLTGTIPILILNPGKFVPNPFFMVALVILILFIVLIFLVERGWCRYFCPVGAILAPLNKVSILHVEPMVQECTHCDACVNVCPMGIDVFKMHRDPECILCGKCVNICPKHLIRYETG